MLKPSIRLALLCVLAVALLPASAQASHVQCGDVITQDTTLDSDLLNCPGDGIVIGADGITLNLAGHLVDGVGFPTSGAGVDNNEGHDGVAVTNGRISGFFAGVRMIGADDNVITRLTVTESATTAYLEDSDGNVVSRNTGEGGILLYGGNDANLIERNTLSTGSGSPGIEIVAAFPYPPNRNRIERNTINGAGEGIGISGGYETTVERNAVSNAGVGITVAGLETRVVRNVVSNSGVGISLGQAHETELVKNDVLANTGDGINVGSPSVETLLDRNTASSNGDDGIDSESTATTLTKNTANDNRDLGIEAVPGVADGGGNKARGNGSPLQCLNIFCK
jgi:parallel beta-helix repeat protein